MSRIEMLMEDLSSIGIIVAVIGSALFPILYSRWPWYKSRLGRILMLKGVADASLMLSYFIVYIFRVPRTSPYRLFHVFVLLFVASTTVMLALLMRDINRNKNKGTSDGKKTDSIHPG